MLWTLRILNNSAAISAMCANPNILPNPSFCPSSPILLNRGNLCSLRYKRSSSYVSSSGRGGSFQERTFYVGPDKVEVLIPPSPSPPLMIEGDEFYVSHDGISRTLYKLNQVSGGGPGFVLEELWNIKNSKKTFVLRTPYRSSTHYEEKQAPQVLGKHEKGIKELGPSLFKLELQEIDQGVFGSAGTGANTWESSIAMVFFFATRPELLQGNVLELGSGVGLGGILTNVASKLATRSVLESNNVSHSVSSPNVANTGMIDSLILTDCNHKVLEQCRENVKQAGDFAREIKVKELDWNRFDAKEIGQFRTIIASDCIYLYPDIFSLGKTIAALLAPGGCFHLFSPYHRAAVREMVQELKEKYNMEVKVNLVEMDRIRLKPFDLGKRKDGENESITISSSKEECSYASSNLAKFLHIEAFHAEIEKNDDFYGID